MKTHFAHFPTGTLVRASDVMKNNKSGHPLGDDVFEVQHMVINGAQSFVLVTNTPDNREVFGEGAMVSFHHDHVAEIVKRGMGPVVIEPQYHKSRILARDIYDDHDSEHQYIVDKLSNRGVRVTKNAYVFFTFESLKFGLLVNKILGDDSERSLDMSRMIQYLRFDSHPEWAFDIQLGDGLGEAWVMPKAKFKRWVKQNVNRFRVNLRAAQKAYDAEMDRIYAEDWERDYEREFRDSPEPVSNQNEGSHYDSEEAHTRLQNDPDYQQEQLDHLTNEDFPGDATELDWRDPQGAGPGDENSEGEANDDTFALGE
jgi:hypothetical protein